MPWLQRVLTTRGLPDGIARISLEVVGACLPAEFEDARRLLARAAGDPGDG